MAKEKTYTLVVWNLFKNNLPFLSHRFSKALRDSDFFLAQEYVSSLENKIPKKHFNETNFTFRIPFRNVSAGTATISKFKPLKAKKRFSKHRELGVATRKSAIATSYKIEDVEITVINLHALNFVRTKSYSDTLGDWLKLVPKQGPVIIAGDFNTWHPKRFDFVDKKLIKKGFLYCHYRQNLIFRLDHIWARGIKVEELVCDNGNHASDHYPLKMVFSIE